MESSDSTEAMVMLRLNGFGHKKNKKGRVAKYSFMLQEHDDPTEEDTEGNPVLDRLDGGEPREMRYTPLRIHWAPMPG